MKLITINKTKFQVKSGVKKRYLSLVGKPFVGSLIFSRTPDLMRFERVCNFLPLILRALSDVIRFGTNPYSGPAMLIN
jgi:hypothetical protein